MDILSILAIGIMISCVIYPLIRASYASISIAIGLFIIFLIEIITMTQSPYIVTSQVVLDLIYYPPAVWTGESLHTLFTSIFLHAGFRHIIFNVLALVFLGIFLEENIGSKKFLAIFLISGIIGNLVFGLVNQNPALGASGAISGILGAIVVLYPMQQFMFFFLPVRLQAWMVAIIFLVLQIYVAFSSDLIAWEAHVGGFAAGMVVARLIMRMDIEERSEKREKVNVFIFAKTTEEKEIARKIRGETIADVKTVWMEELASTAKCPICGERLRVYRRRFKCRNGHRFDI